MDLEQEEKTGKSERPFKKWFLKGLLWVLATGVGLFGLMFLLLFIFQDQAKEYIVAKVNEHLNTVIYIDPENIELSLLQDFPNVSVEFRQVNAMDAIDIPKRDTLFSANRIGLSFGIFDFLSSNYAIHNIEMEDARLRLWIDSAGRDNFHFLKDTEGNSDTANVKFDLERIALYNVQVNFNDRSSNSDYAVTLNTMICSGEFTSDQYDLEAKSEFTVGKLRYQNASFFAGNKGNMSLDLHVDNSSNTYSIQKGTLQLSDVSLQLTGQIRNAGRLPLVDLTLSGQDIGLAKALTLLPERYRSDIDDFEADGRFYTDLTVKGYLSDSLIPLVKGSFGIHHGGSISRSGSPVRLSNIAMKGHFSNEAGHDGFELSEFSASTKASQFSGKFSMRGLQRPAYSASLSGRIDLAEMQDLLRIDTLEKASGKIDLKITTSGRASKSSTLSPSDFRTFTTTGEARFNNVIIQPKQSAIPIDSMSGNLGFDGNTVRVDHFRVRSYNSDLQFNGTVRNLFGYLFTEREILEVNANLNAETLDLNAILQDESTHHKKDTVYHLELPDRIAMQLKAKVDYLRFRKFEARAMSGNVQLNNRRMIADPVTFQTMDGIVNGSGMIDGSRITTLLMTGNAHVEHIDMYKLFVECENFGQDVITDRHVRGNVTSDFNFASVWNDKLILDEQKLYARSNLKIEQGQLIDFQPLTALSRFIKLDDLRNIRFSTLQNTIEIKDRTIFIPEMDIHSSAIDIIMSGIHDFDNIVDYHFIVGLDELKARKFKSANPNNTELDITEETEAGPTTRLFIRMKGPLENPDIRYDSKGAVKGLQAGLKNEKQSLKQVLNEEFGWFKKDPAVKKQSEPSEGNSKKTDQDGKFIIRFEEGKDEEAPPDDEEY